MVSHQAQEAAAVRETLRKNFLRTKFRVVSSGVYGVCVSWTDGPTKDEVGDVLVAADLYLSGHRMTRKFSPRYLAAVMAGLQARDGWPECPIMDHGDGTAAFSWDGRKLGPEPRVKDHWGREEYLTLACVAKAHAGHGPDTRKAG